MTAPKDVLVLVSKFVLTVRRLVAQIDARSGSRLPAPAERIASMQAELDAVVLPLLAGADEEFTKAFLGICQSFLRHSLLSLYLLESSCRQALTALLVQDLPDQPETLTAGAEFDADLRAEALSRMQAIETLCTGKAIKMGLLAQWQRNWEASARPASGARKMPGGDW